MTGLERIRSALGNMPEASELGVPGLSTLTPGTLTESQGSEIASLLRAARRAGREDERKAKREHPLKGKAGQKNAQRRARGER